MSEVATMEATAAIAPKSPTLHLLPLSLGRLSEHADQKGGGRFNLSGVRLEFDGLSFTATATDTKQLVRVEGTCSDPESFPVDCVPGLGASPNGATSATIPAKTWGKVFQQANRMKFKRNNAAATVACVTGDTVTTFGATDAESRMCEQTMNVEGRFPPVVDILKQCEKKRTKNGITFAVDPAYLINLLQTAQKIGGDSERVTIEIVDGLTPIILRAGDGAVKFTGLLMPLKPEPSEYPQSGTEENYAKWIARGATLPDKEPTATTSAEDYFAS